jgi:hypothetical protein
MRTSLLTNGSGVSAVEAGDESTLDDVYSLLSNRRRRFVIHRLLQTGDTCSLRDLSRMVAAWEYEKEPREVSATERHRVYNGLQQLHLPKLDRAGLVEYDADRGVVRPTTELAEMRLYLEVVPRSEIPWSTYYLLLSLFAALFSTVSWVGVGPFARVPIAVATAIVVTFFTVSALVHTRYTRRQRMGSDGLPPERRP